MVSIILDWRASSSKTRRSSEIERLRTSSVTNVSGQTVCNSFPNAAEKSAQKNGRLRMRLSMFFARLGIKISKHKSVSRELQRIQPGELAGDRRQRPCSFRLLNKSTCR